MRVPVVNSQAGPSRQNTKDEVMSDDSMPPLEYIGKTTPSTTTLPTIKYSVGQKLRLTDLHNSTYNKEIVLVVKTDFSGASPNYTVQLSNGRRLMVKSHQLSEVLQAERAPVEMKPD